MNTDMRRGTPQKKWMIAHHRPPSLWYERWNAPGGFFFWCWVVSPRLCTWFIEFVWYCNSVCSSTRENLKGTAIGRKKEGKKATQECKGCGGQNTAGSGRESDPRSARASHRGEESGNIVFQQEMRYGSCSTHLTWSILYTHVIWKIRNHLQVLFILLYLEEFRLLSRKASVML